MDSYQSLKDQYREATMQHLAKEHLCGQNWTHFQSIRHDARNKKKELNKTYEAEYKTRVTQETRRLQRQAGSPTRTLKPKYLGIDQFDKTSLKQQAVRNVENRHHARIALVEKREEDSVEKLVEKAKARRQLKGQPTQAFNRTTDRRSGIDRRQSSDGAGMSRRKNNAQENQSKPSQSTNSQTRNNRAKHSTSTQSPPSIRRRR